LQLFKAPLAPLSRWAYNVRNIFPVKKYCKVKFLFLTMLDGLIREYLLHKSS
jgi:hypothetical protein